MAVNEYIERGRLIDDLTLLAKYQTGERQQAILGAIETIRLRKAADVEPVRHGRWVEQEKYAFGTMHDCSICDNRILDNGHSWNYCPNRGAKMDEVSE